VPAYDVPPYNVAPYEPGRPLIFMHIPKTAGIAICDALVQAVRPTRVFFGFDLAFFGPFDDFASVDPATRGFIHTTPETLPPGEKLVRAHMSLGTLRAAYPDGQFLTVLREPVSRILSHFLFWRGFSDAQIREWGGWAAVMRLAQGDLAGLLESPAAACQIDNVALRLLLWPNPAIADGGFIPPAEDAALLLQAQAALRGFSFSAAQEDPGFWPALSAWLGRPFAAASRNVTPPLPAERRLDLAAALTPGCRDLLRQRTRLDRVLWDMLRGGADDGFGERIQQATISRLGTVARPPAP
jgi:hypothetical protein